MPTVSVRSAEDYGSLTRTVWTDTQLRQAWHALDKQGNKEARQRGRLCVVVECSEPEALALSRVFVERFAIPSCCHYDGKRLSMYCGAAGGGFAELRKYVANLSVKTHKG